MKKILKVNIGIVFLLIVITPNVLAQRQSDKSSVFASIKAQMKDVADENVELAEENKALRSQLISLQLQIDKHEKQIGMLDPNFKKTVEYTREKGQEHDLDTKKIENTALIQEAQELYLSGQHMDLSEEQRLLELKLYDLQYQKQELELDLKDRQALYENVDGQRQEEIEVIEQRIDHKVKEEEYLRLKLAEAEKNLISYPREIELLQMENAALKKKIGQLKKVLSR